jgi:hypothetical protein
MIKKHLRFGHSNDLQLSCLHRSTSSFISAFCFVHAWNASDGYFSICVSFARSSFRSTVMRRSASAACGSLKRLYDATDSLREAISARSAAQVWFLETWTGGGVRDGDCLGVEVCRVGWACFVDGFCFVHGLCFLGRGCFIAVLFDAVTFLDAVLSCFVSAANQYDECGMVVYQASEEIRMSGYRSGGEREKAGDV